MSEADIENIKITTPLGDCLIPFNRQEIIKFVKQVAQENENRNTIHNQDVAEFLEIEIGDEDEEYEWWDDIYVPSRLYDLEQFIAKEYKICKITNYSRRGMKRNAVVKKKISP
jgi:tRNA G10  N-methylase Trm11